jgi:hypothetical protein
VTFNEQSETSTDKMEMFKSPGEAEPKKASALPAVKVAPPVDFSEYLGVA